MQTETIIQSITVGQNLQRTYTVGDEINGQAIIEFKQIGYETESSTHSEFVAFGENGEVILSVENMPVIAEWKTIAVDGEQGDESDE